MPRPCSVCAHKDRPAIDTALASETSRRAIAGSFGISLSSLHRHSKHNADQRGPIRTEQASGSAPNKPPANRTSAEAIERARTEARALELRLAGNTYREIAAELRIAPSTAHDLVDRVMLQRRKETGETAERAREIELERLDRLQRGLWDRATDPAMAIVDVPADNEAGVRPYDGQDKAADRVIKISERRAKLLGLDAPTTTYAVDLVLQHPVVSALWRSVGEVLETFPEAKAAVTARLVAIRAEHGTKRLDSIGGAPVREALGIARTPELTSAMARANRGDEGGEREAERYAVTGFSSGDPRFNLDAFIERLIVIVPEIAPRIAKSPTAQGGAKPIGDTFRCQ